MIENSWRNVEDQFSFKIFCSRKFGEIFGHFKHKYFHFINRITNYWTIFLISAIWDLFMGHLDEAIFALTEWLLIAHTENGYFGTNFFYRYGIFYR